jgi:hypothetical protein
MRTYWSVLHNFTAFVSSDLGHFSMQVSGTTSLQVKQLKQEQDLSPDELNKTFC